MEKMPATSDASIAAVYCIVFALRLDGLVPDEFLDSIRFGGMPKFGPG